MKRRRQIIDSEDDEIVDDGDTHLSRALGEVSGSRKKKKKTRLNQLVLLETEDSGDEDILEGEDDVDEYDLNDPFINNQELEQSNQESMDERDPTSDVEEDVGDNREDNESNGNDYQINDDENQEDINEDDEKHIVPPVDTDVKASIVLSECFPAFKQVMMMIKENFPKIELIISNQAMVIKSESECQTMCVHAKVNITVDQFNGDFSTFIKSSTILSCLQCLRYTRGDTNINLRIHDQDDKWILESECDSKDRRSQLDFTILSDPPPDIQIPEDRVFPITICFSLNLFKECIGALMSTKYDNCRFKIFQSTYRRKPIFLVRISADGEPSKGEFNWSQDFIFHQTMKSPKFDIIISDSQADAFCNPIKMEAEQIMNGKLIINLQFQVKYLREITKPMKDEMIDLQLDNCIMKVTSRIANEVAQASFYIASLTEETL